jgi:hypothetical protein
MRLRRTALIAISMALLAVASAAAAGTATKTETTQSNMVYKQLAAGQTRTVDVPYPDALKYGNARYSGRVTLAATRATTGKAPNLKLVEILSRGSALGGSEYQVRAHNGNAPGTAPVRLDVTATTVEPLPHS